MDRDELDELWRREGSEESRANALSREDLAEMVVERTLEVRTSLQRRLKQEIGYYATILALFIASIVFSALPKILLLPSVAFGLVLGGLMVTLHRGSRRLGSPDLAGSTEEAIRRTLRVLDGTMRAYLIAYVLCLAFGAVMTIVLIATRHPRWIVPAVLAGVLGLVWSYRSGRAYLERRFGTDRKRLAQCLAGLEAP